MPQTIRIKPTRNSEIRRYMGYSKKDLAILLYDITYALNVVSKRLGIKVTQSASAKRQSLRRI